MEDRNKIDSECISEDFIEKYMTSPINSAGKWPRNDLKWPQMTNFTIEYWLVNSSFKTEKQLPE